VERVGASSGKSINAVQGEAWVSAKASWEVHVRLQMCADEACSCGSDSSFTGGGARV
jgi:hypothetical protein